MEPWDITIENVAGIRAGDATIHPGVNTVKAENWQGKSSFIAAIQAAMGTATPLTEGATVGSVRLDTGDGTYAVELTRRSGDVVVDGEPVLEAGFDRVCADLYAFMDGTNEVREAVRAGENLEDVLTRPLDFENLDERIAERRRERDQVDAELERAVEAAATLPDAAATVNDLESAREALRHRRDELVAADDDRTDGDARERLSDVRAERDRVAARLERLEDSLDRAASTLADRREELDSLEAADPRDVADELATEREALAAVERDVELLQAVYAAANRLLEEERFDLLADVEHGVMDDSVTCLLCGDDVPRGAFAEHLSTLGDRVLERREAAADRRERIDELEAERAERSQRRRRRADLEAAIADLETTVGEREESLSTARERLAALESDLADLAETVEAHDDELAEVEAELKYVEAELDDARAAHDAEAALAERRTVLAEERETLTEEIATLRSRKDELKRRARAAFDEAMADLLERFDTGFETARLTSGFDLVVARDGREASLEALSEGELELIGLVAALAGHQAFEVGSIVPLLLLDDLGALSDESLHTVVEMFDDHVDRLVLTAYPEQSAFEGAVIDPSDWSVVSHPNASAQP